MSECECCILYKKAIATVRGYYPKDIFPEEICEGKTEESRRARAAAAMVRITCDNIEKLVKEAGLDCW